MLGLIRTHSKPALTLGITASLPLLLFFAWNLSVHDMWLTVSYEAKSFYSAKQAWDFEGSWNRIVATGNYLVLSFSTFFMNRSPFAFGKTAEADVLNTFAPLILLLPLVGLWQFRSRLRHQAIPIALIAYAGVHAAVYAFRMPSYASHAYFSWYYVPQIFVITLLTALAFDGLRRLPLLQAIALFALLATLWLNGRQLFSQHYLPDVYNDLVLLGRELNERTPPGARIGSPSAGTQAFFLEGGRRMTNLDGLANSSEFLREHLVSKGLLDFMAKQRIIYYTGYFKPNPQGKRWTMSGEALPDDVEVVFTGNRYGSHYSILKLP